MTAARRIDRGQGPGQRRLHRAGASASSRVEYFHIELETHDVIIAEGRLVGEFHRRRQPLHVPQRARISRALSRCCGGAGAILRATAMRTAMNSRRCGGALHCGPGLLASPQRRASARCAAMSIVSIRAASKAGRRTSIIPEAPVCLDIFVGGRLIGQTLANRYREDLKQAGLGSGGHAFSFTPPENLFCTSGAVEVRRSLDGVALKLSIAAQQALRRLSPPARATSGEAAVSPLSTIALGA